MNEVQKLACSVLQRQENSVRFSITLAETDNRRLEELAELAGFSKSAFCSELIGAALSDMEALVAEPESDVEIEEITMQEYKDAFIDIKPRLTVGHCAMLKAHFHAENYTVTATELAEAAGYANYGGANLQYARIGKMLADYLRRELPTHTNGSPFPTAMLVEWHFKNTEQTWYCTLRPEVVAALKVTGLVKK